MHMRLIVLASTILFLLLLAPATVAQTDRFNVSGSVIDDEELPLPQATVVLLTRTDSVLTKFTTSASDGRFILRRVLAGEYILQITYVGFSTLRQDIELLDEDLDVGKLSMATLVEELGEVVVSADHIPFVVKRDTLEYNANAFTVRPNDVVEDLLKRLPGIEVEADGSIKAQGETVENVLVDGKEFFADTPSAVTKNLPAQAVDKVQVYDKDSDQAEFTGVPDGQEEKTIDLLLKEDAKQGLMGNLSGAIGGEQTPGGRYATRVNLMRFSPNTQLSVFGNANNVGQSGIGVQDIVGMVMAGGGTSFISPGMLRSLGSGGDGFSESITLGLNAGHDFSENNYLRGSYSLDKQDQLRNSTTQRNELAGQNASAYGDDFSTANTDNLGHRVNLNAQVQLSPGHRIRARGTMRWSLSGLAQTGVQKTFGGQQLLINEAQSAVDSENTSINGSGTLTWRKKLSDSGTSLVATAGLTLSDSDEIAELLTRTGIASTGNIMTWQEVQQDQDQFGRTQGTDIRLSLTHPMENGFSILTFGEWDFSRREEDKRFYDTRDRIRQLNPRLSRAFERTYTYYRTGIRLTRDDDSGWLALQVHLQRSQLDGTSDSNLPAVTAGYTHVLPEVQYRRTLKENQTVQVRYGTDTREPTLQELQPFSDNRNPLRIYAGNPDLEPETSHSVYGSFQSFDPWTYLIIFASLRTTYTRNQIVPTRSIDTSLRQTVSAINSDAGWNTQMRASVGMPIRPLNIKVRLNNNLNLSTGSEFINSAENSSRIVRNGLGITISNRDQDIIELEAGIRGTYNYVDYSINTNLNQQYINSSYTFDVSWHPTFNWTINADLRYQTYDQDVFGEVRNKALIGASLKRLFMDERASITLEVYDLLNQNLDVSFNNSASFISERRTETLGRYLMLRLTYRLSAVGGGFFREL
ncbi:MAG: TonB-dependent receptor [Rhodothermaceae bacterium]|nr:TonB-dependent receptor [Rhodothermaceae bacterium]